MYWQLEWVGHPVVLAEGQMCEVWNFNTRTSHDLLNASQKILGGNEVQVLEINEWTWYPVNQGLRNWWPWYTTDIVQTFSCSHWLSLASHAYLALGYLQMSESSSCAKGKEILSNCRVPWTFISGFLGAVKSTLLRYATHSVSCVISSSSQGWSWDLQVCFLYLPFFLSFLLFFHFLCYFLRVRSILIQVQASIQLCAQTQAVKHFSSIQGQSNMYFMHTFTNTPLSRHIIPTSHCCSGSLWSGLKYFWISLLAPLTCMRAHAQVHKHQCNAQHHWRSSCGLYILPGKCFFAGHSSCL